MKKYFLLPAFVAAAFPAMSQSIVFADDALGRGYVDRPYLRYEAEEGSISAIGNVDFINAAPTIRRLSPPRPRTCRPLSLRRQAAISNGSLTPMPMP